METVYRLVQLFLIYTGAGAFPFPEISVFLFSGHDHRPYCRDHRILWK